MVRTLKTLLAVAGIAMLGLLASVAVAGMDGTSGATDPAATSTEATTQPLADIQTTTDGSTATTEPATTTAPTTTAVTTAPATTAPTTTTDPATTAATTTAAPTTSDATTTAAPTTGGGLTQSTPQATASPPATGGTTAQTQTQPCQTPTNPGVTCGNNAATQLAVVTQNCKSDATIATSGLVIQILNADGSVAKTAAIDNKSICLNYSQITQIVQQICVNCTLVVQNYYSTTNQTTNQTIVNGWTGPRYVGYCMPADRPRPRGDGTVGWLVFIEEGRPGWDPVYTGAKPASFDSVGGYSCPGMSNAPVPNTFTLTVPAAFIGRFINLCLQPDGPAAKPICHSVQIDASSKITIPVRSNITASVTRTPKAKLVSRAGSKAVAGLLAGKKSKRCVAAGKPHLKTTVSKKHCVAPKKTQKGRAR
jgi:hypothetical protein